MLLPLLIQYIHFGREKQERGAMSNGRNPLAGAFGTIYSLFSRRVRKGAKHAEGKKGFDFICG
jgi:hypothetical protein